MITILRRLVYFGTLFLAVMAIMLMMIKDDLGYIPDGVQVFMLSLIFVLGIMLIILMVKRGMGG